jgi:hypothetical protein
MKGNADGYTTSIRNELYRSNFFAVDLVEVHLPRDEYGDSLYLCTGGFPIVWDSTTAPRSGPITYEAQGQFMGFSGIGEDFDVKVGKLTIYLSGVDNNYVGRFVDKDFEGQRVVLHKAFLDINTLALVGNPVMMFDGQIYNTIIKETSRSCQLNIECASLFADFERAAGRRSNNYSNWRYQGSEDDRCFQYAAQVDKREILWGRKI